MYKRQTYADEFERIGVEVRDEDGGLRSLPEVFNDVVVGLQNAGNDTAALAAAQDLLGRSGLRVAAAFRTSEGDLASLQAALAGQYNDTVNLQALRAEQLKDRFTELGTEWQDFTRTLLDTEGPIGDFFDRMVSGARIRLMELSVLLEAPSLDDLRNEFAETSRELDRLSLERQRLIDVGNREELVDQGPIGRERRRLSAVLDGLREEIRLRTEREQALLKENEAEQEQVRLQQEATAERERLDTEAEEEKAREEELTRAREAALTAFERLAASQRTQVEAANAAYEEGRAVIQAYLDTITGESPEAEEAIRRLGVSLTEALAFPAGDFLGGMDDDDAPDILPDNMELEDFYGDLARGTAGAFQRGITEGGRAGVDALLQVLTQLITPLLENLFSNLAGGEGGGTGSILGSLFGGARQQGGPVFPGRTYLVGERGPEFFRPDRPGLIDPNTAGGTSVEINQTLVGDVDQPVIRSMRRQAYAQADILRSVDRERRLTPRA